MMNDEETVSKYNRIANKATSYEASTHMAEETSNAKTNAPLGIVSTCFATGLGGVTLLFCTRDIRAILNNDDGGGATMRRCT